MRGAIITAMSIVCLTAMSAISSAEMINVPGTNADGVWSAALEAGKVYEIRAEGTYEYSGGQAADAEWSVFNGPWIEEYSLPGYPVYVLDVLINGGAYDWMGTTDGISFSPHTFSPSHEYKVLYVGQGMPINLSILDVDYRDNSGSLTVTIGEVPEPATLSLLMLGSLAVMRRKR